ncbi:MAG: hypothetical protein KDD48_05175 [Bdellovibrionales bacterium]|nr:hypothetical protein [Bdellovibrionales bacterium]
MADTTAQIMQALNQATANASPTGSNCNWGSGLQTRGPSQTYTPYDPSKPQGNDCQPGESYADCMKRIYKIK